MALDREVQNDAVNLVGEFHPGAHEEDEERWRQADEEARESEKNYLEKKYRIPRQSYWTETTFTYDDNGVQRHGDPAPLRVASEFRPFRSKVKQYRKLLDLLVHSMGLNKSARRQQVLPTLIPAAEAAFNELSSSKQLNRTLKGYWVPELLSAKETTGAPHPEAPIFADTWKSYEWWLDELAEHCDEPLEWKVSNSEIEAQQYLDNNAYEESLVASARDRLDVIDEILEDVNRLIDKVLAPNYRATKGGDDLQSRNKAGPGSQDAFSFLRSKAMLDAANAKQPPAVWKIGESHIVDIAHQVDRGKWRLEPHVTLTSRADFEAELQNTDK